VLAGLLGDPQLPAERHPRFVEAKAAYDAATVDLAHTVVKAPAAGVVTNMKLQVGEHVEKGSAIFSIIQSGPVWVEANFKETQLTYMRPGQRAIVVADAYPDIEWQAKVLAISAATGAEFAVLPPQNATGNWVKVVQRLPVQLEVEQPPGQQQLRAGMTVTVTVDTGRERGLPRPVRRLVDKGWLPSFLEPRTALARGEK
jgi:membrane fusion protein (multidrug efflux system)